MTPEGLFVGALFLAVAVALLGLARRWRSRAPRIAISVAIWAALVYAIPATFSLTAASNLQFGSDDAPPYVGLFVLWLFLLLPTTAGVGLAYAYLRGEAPRPVATPPDLAAHKPGK